MMVRQARLEAQTQGMPTFQLTQKVNFDGDPGDVHLAALYADENDAFQQLDGAYRKQLEILQQQKPRIEAEIDAIRSEGLNERRRLEILSAQVETLDAVFKKGYVRRAVLDDKMREEAAAHADVARVTAQLERLQRESSDADMKIDDVDANYKRQALVELQDTRQRLRELEVTLASARELRAVKASLATGNDDDDSPRYKVMITRVGKAAGKTFRASDETIVQPGDVIEIRSRRPNGLSRLPQQPTSFNGDASSLIERVVH
jgi:polysaccharide export outer membrane protein